MADMVKSLMSKAGFLFGNENEYPVNAMNYFVILGTAILSFSKISGIHLYQMQADAVTEGGMIEPYIVEGENKELNSITFEKGYGTTDVMSVIKRAKVFMLFIKDDTGKICGAYYSNRIFVKSVSISDLDASKSQVLIQKLTIVYTTLKRSDSLAKIGEVSGNFFAPNRDENMASIQRYTDQLKAKKNQKGTTQTAQDTALIMQETARLKELKQKTLTNKDVTQASQLNAKIQQERLKKEEEKNQAQIEKQLQLEKTVEL